MIILVLFIIWNSIHLGYRYQKEVYYAERGILPMTLILSNQEKIDSLASILSNFPFIESIITESDNALISKLIEIYDLEYAREILESYHLPGVITLYFNGNLFDNDQKILLENSILKLYSGIIINFNEEHWTITQHKIELLDKLYLYANVFYVVLFLFITIFLRIHFEYKKDEYWRIYKLSGGQINLRKRSYAIDSSLILFIPYLVALLLFFLAFYLKYLPFFPEIRLLGAEFVTLLLSTVVSGLIVGYRIR
ncbi:MAG: hypothetical protein JXB60_01965 [Candidatus Cloacimonetes bacterium]|nr:hypothetical protein [Candidatus Cloacimonadota bacterium]